MWVTRDFSVATKEELVVPVVPDVPVVTPVFPVVPVVASANVHDRPEASSWAIVMAQFSGERERILRYWKPPKQVGL